jgi:hypothetical protein
MITLIDRNYLSKKDLLQLMNDCHNHNSGIP